MKVLFWRLVENVISVLEGILIFVQMVIVGVVVGIGWAAKEIFDQWTLGEPMHLIPDWRVIWRRAYSIKFGIASGLFAAADLLLPYLMNRDPGNRLLIWLSIASAFLGVLARLFAQKEITNVPAQPPAAEQ